jgi:hypothetical protein
MQALKTVVRNVALLALIPAGAVVYSSISHVPAPSEQVFINKAQLDSKVWLVQQIKPLSLLNVTSTPLTSAQKSVAQLACSSTVSLQSRIDAANTALLKQSTAVSADGKPVQGNYLLNVQYAFDTPAILAKVAAKPAEGMQRLSDVCSHLYKFALKEGANYADLLWQEQVRGTETRKQFEASAVPGQVRAQTYAMYNYGKGKSNPWAALNGCTYLHTANRQLAYLDSKGETESLRLLDLCISEQPDHPTAQAKRLSADNAPSNWQQIGPALRAAAAVQFDTASGWLGLGAQGNSVTVLKRSVPQGAHVVATLDNKTQATAQGVANCLTGDRNSKDCDGLGIDRSQWGTFYEKSASRMMGIAVIDLPTGEIQAIASSHTKCYEQQYDGPGRDADCPDIPAIPSKKTHMLDNHALYTQVMPGSLVKPVTALAMLQDPAYRKQLMGVDADAFKYELMRSNSRAFHSRLFCAEKEFKDCLRPSYVPAAADLLGWNIGCLNKAATSGKENSGKEKSATANDTAAKALNVNDCTKFSAATGQSIAAQRAFQRSKAAEKASDLAGDAASIVNKGSPALTVPGANLGIQKLKAGNEQPAYYAVHKSGFSVDWAKECGDVARDTQQWSKCKGGTGSAIEMLSEAWGQGDARATPLSAAVMMAHLGAAANGQAQVKLPHLLNGAINPKFQAFEAIARKHGIDPAQAQFIVSGLQGGHTTKGKDRNGTAHSACEKVLGGCNNIQWIAGKTATPVFNFDQTTVDKRAAVCAALYTQPKLALTPPEPTESDSALDDDTEDDLPDSATLQKRIAKLDAQMFHCNASPYKWYAALIKSGGNQQAQWDKVIVVLAERNWDEKTQKVDAPGDVGENIAARAAFEIIKRVYAKVP